jgi:hypothetical protein
MRNTTWKPRLASPGLLVLSLLFIPALSPTLDGHEDGPKSERKPREVERYGSGYRYSKDGWLILHVEGDPYPRGYQQGRLLSAEIASYVRMLARDRYPKDPHEGWRTVRVLADSLFLRKLDREFLEEMKGIADGAAAAGARFGDRPIDLIDVAAANVWQELETLEQALAVAPTGLEGIKFPRPGPELPSTPVPPKKDHCSAFAATGPATAGGKIVFGHITMFGLQFGPYVNVWIDCQPSRGHRFVMQGFPGAVWSSQDYYQNDAGILLCETTIDQTPFDPTGEPVTTRARKAIQYGESIDDVVKILSTRNSGLYTNEWLIGDIKTDEIAMYELGTKKSRLWRSSRNEWFGDTQGFYWGCNNTKDTNVRLEANPSTGAKEEVPRWSPTDRDTAWQKFYAKYQGKIDEAAAREAFSAAPIAGATSLDAKITTAALARDVTARAIYGPPTGKTWKPTAQERIDYPDIQPLEPHAWTLLTIAPPMQEKREEKRDAPRR